MVAELGLPCRDFSGIEEIPPAREHMLVGFVGEVQGQLMRLGVAAPDIDYPPELSRWMGRVMSKTTLELAELYMYEHPARPDALC